MTDTDLLDLVNSTVQFDGLRHDHGQLVSAHSRDEGLPPASRTGGGQGGGTTTDRLRVGALADDSGAVLGLEEMVRVALSPGSSEGEGPLVVWSQTGPGQQGSAAVSLHYTIFLYCNLRHTRTSTRTKAMLQFLENGSFLYFFMF